jgi:hypothetical protein
LPWSRQRRGRLMEARNRFERRGRGAFMKL